MAAVILLARSLWVMKGRRHRLRRGLVALEWRAGLTCNF